MDFDFGWAIEMIPASAGVNRMKSFGNSMSTMIPASAGVNRGYTHHEKITVL